MRAGFLRSMRVTMVMMDGKVNGRCVRIMADENQGVCGKRWGSNL